MDRRRHLAAGPGHASVGDQRDLVPAVLEDSQGRHQLVQLGHAVGARTLEPNYYDYVAVELAGLERLEHLILVGEAARRSFDQPALLVDRAGLEDRAAEVAADEAHPAVGLERICGGTEHVGIGAFLGALPD